MTLSDEQIGQLLREVPLPPEPYDRLAAVTGRRRARDRRNLSLLGAALASVLVAGSVSVVALRPEDQPSGIDRLLSGGTTTATMSGTVTEGGRQVGTLSGAVDFRTNRMTYTVHGTSGGVTTDLEVRQIGDELWFRFEGAAALGGLPAGKRWLHSKDRAVAEQSAQFDPGALLEVLRDARSTIEDEGTGTVDGVATTRYRVVVPDDDEDLIFAGETVELDVDDAGLVRRISAPAGDGQTQVIRFGDFGAPVSIEPPPAAEVAEQSELFDEVGGKEALCRNADDILARLPEDQRARARETFESLCGPTRP